jgi:hypothetical protein
MTIDSPTIVSSGESRGRNGDIVLSREGDSRVELGAYYMLRPRERLRERKRIKKDLSDVYPLPTRS